MNNIPYELYIHFDVLKPLFNESSSYQENTLRCGFASLELTTNLLGTISTQLERPQLSKTILHLLDGIETQLHVLNTYDWNEPLGPYRICHSTNWECLKGLNQDYTNNIDQITSIFFQLSQKISTGLEDQMNDIRRHFALTKIETNTIEERSTDSVLSMVIPSLKLDELTYFNSEDKLFMVTHQISECWFNIIIQEIQMIEKCLQQSTIDSERIQTHFDAAYTVLMYLAEHILLLEHMVLSDYHPLRVALRGASGGQSQQAYNMFRISQQSYREYLSHVQRNGHQLTEIIEKPSTHSKLLIIMNAFSKLERAMKNFFFQHYILSSSVIGSQSFGSIGYDLVSLVDKFVEPIFKEIDQAKYDLTLKTNFQYGARAGTLIYEREETIRPINKSDISVDLQLKQRVISSYFEAISALDLQKWVQLFSEDGFIEDPVGSRPYAGHDQLAIFFKGVVRFFAELSMTIERIDHRADTTSVLWKAKARTYNEKCIQFNGEEIFRIDKKGKISSAEVKWNPEMISDQL